MSLHNLFCKLVQRKSLGLYAEGGAIHLIEMQATFAGLKLTKYVKTEIPESSAARESDIEAQNQIRLLTDKRLRFEKQLEELSEKIKEAQSKVETQKTQNQETSLEIDPILKPISLQGAPMPEIPLAMSKADEKLSPDYMTPEQKEEERRFGELVAESIRDLVDRLDLLQNEWQKSMLQTTEEFKQKRQALQEEQIQLEAQLKSSEEELSKLIAAKEREELNILKQGERRSEEIWRRVTQMKKTIIDRQAEIKERLKSAWEDMPQVVPGQEGEPHPGRTFQGLVNRVEETRMKLGVEIADKYLEIEGELGKLANIQQRIEECKTVWEEKLAGKKKNCMEVQGEIKTRKNEIDALLQQQETEELEARKRKVREYEAEMICLEKELYELRGKFETEIAILTAERETLKISAQEQLRDLDELRKTREMERRIESGQELPDESSESELLKTIMEMVDAKRKVEEDLSSLDHKIQMAKVTEAMRTPEEEEKIKEENRKNLVDTIAKAVKSGNIDLKTCRLVTTPVLQDTFIRYMQYPAAVKSHIKHDTLIMEIARQTPYKPDRLVYDYAVRKGRKMFDVCFTGVKKETYDYWDRCFKQVGFKHIKCEPLPNAMLRLYYATKKVSPAKTEMFLNLNGVSSSLVVARNGWPIHFQEIDASGTTGEGISKFLTDIQLVLNFCRQKYGIERMQRFVLTGPEPSSHLKDELELRLGMKPEFFKPFEADPEQIKKSAGLATVFAKGLALRELGFVCAPLNMARPGYLYSQRDNLVKDLVIEAVAIAIAWAAVGLGLGNRMAALKEEYLAYREMNAKHDWAQGKNAMDLEELKKVLLSKKRLIEEVVGGRVIWSKQLENLCNILDKDMWLIRIDGESHFQMQGKDKDGKPVLSGGNKRLRIEGGLIMKDEAQAIRAVEGFIIAMRQNPVMGRQFQRMELERIQKNMLVKNQGAVPGPGQRPGQRNNPRQPPVQEPLNNAEQEELEYAAFTVNCGEPPVGRQAQTGTEAIKQ